jgi:hypothetical protein
MILFGVVWLIVASRLPNSKPVRVYDDSDSGETVAKTAEEKASERNQRRKLRRKLR